MCGSQQAIQLSPSLRVPSKLKVLDGYQEACVLQACRGVTLDPGLFLFPFWETEPPPSLRYTEHLTSRIINTLRDKPHFTPRKHQVSEGIRCRGCWRSRAFLEAIRGQPWLLLQTLSMRASPDSDATQRCHDPLHFGRTCHAMFIMALSILFWYHGECSRLSMIRKPTRRKVCPNGDLNSVFNTR